MDDLIAFITARLDEDEAAAAAAPGSTWTAFTEDDIAGASVYDEQWVLLYPQRYDHDNKLSAKPEATGPAYIQKSRDELAAHIARHDPARVLREVAAKRAILAEHASFAPGIGPSRGEPCCTRCGAGFDDVYLTCPWPCDTLKVLAAVWSDHPDYRQEWAPRP